MIRFIKQIIKFSLVGGISALVDFGSYFALTRTIDILRFYYVGTSIFTSLMAIGVNYLINRRWTFRDPQGISLKQYGHYLFVYGLGIVWHNGLLALFVEWFNLPDLVAKLFAVLIVGYGWNFVLAKFWVFGYNIR